MKPKKVLAITGGSQSSIHYSMKIYKWKESTIYSALQIQTVF